MDNFPSFSEWLASRQEESSAFTRRRDAAAQGLAPKLPDASMHSHSTYPWADNVKKYGSKWGPKKKKKKKHKKKKMDESFFGLGNPKIKRYLARPMPAPTAHDMEWWAHIDAHTKQEIVNAQLKMWERSYFADAAQHVAGWRELGDSIR